LPRAAIFRSQGGQNYALRRGQFEMFITTCVGYDGQKRKPKPFGLPLVANVVEIEV